MARVNGQSANSALTGFTGSILTLLEGTNRRIQRRFAGTFLRGEERDHGRCRESGRYVLGAHDGSLAIAIGVTFCSYKKLAVSETKPVCHISLE